MREIRISLLGHKDHGKSTLIGRLLHDTRSITQDRINEAIATSKALGKEFEYAFLLDSFEEERGEGFTLDTTRAQVRHGGAIYELIDVPGHRELVKNMLSGASMAHAAVLIVSAKEGEGLQTETRLHVYLARMLGIGRLVVAVNKMDLAGYSQKRFTDVKADVEKVLAGFGFDPSALSFVPVSAMKGDNLLSRSGAMGWYSGRTVMEHMESFPDSEAGLQKLPMRMFVQDVYEDVVAGRLETGRVAAGEEIAVEPSGATAKIERIFLAGREGSEARAGQNVGFKLSPQGGVARGCVCMPPGQAKAARAVRARVFCFGSHLDAGDSVHVTCATQESMARVASIFWKVNPISDSAPVKGAWRVAMFEGAEVGLELEKPLVLERFADMPATGRFVLSKDGRAVAAGIVP